MPLNETQRFFYQDVVDIWRQGTVIVGANALMIQAVWQKVASAMPCDHQTASNRFVAQPALGLTPIANADVLDEFHFEYGQDVRLEDILIKRTPGARDFNHGFRVVASEAARQSPEANYAHVRAIPVVLPGSIPPYV